MNKILVLVLCVLMFGNVYSVGTQPTDSWTEQYLAMNNDWLDSTPNSNNATNSGTTSTTGILNESYNFDNTGTPSQTVDSEYQIPNNADFTINLWVKNDGNSGQWNAIITDQTTSGISIRFYQAGTRTDLKIDCGGTNTLSAYLYPGSSTGDVDLGDLTGKWNMTTFAYDHSLSKGYIYIDGDLKYEADGTCGTHDSNIILGSYFVASSNGVNAFTGDMDEYSMFSEVLVTDNVDFLYQLGSPTVEQQYPFGIVTPVITNNMTASYDTTTINIKLESVTNVNMSYNLDSSSYISICNNCSSYDLTLDSLAEGSHNIIFNSTNSGGTQTVSENFEINAIHAVTMSESNGTLHGSVPFQLNFLTDLVINMNLSINGGAYSNICTDSLNCSYVVASAIQEINNITIRAYSEASFEDSKFYFDYDSISPTISIIGNLTQKYFEVDFSTIFNISDLNPDTCILNITYLENVTNASAQDRIINCDASTTFVDAGSYNLFLTATDLVGNIATLNVNGTIEPIISLNFFNDNLVAITNYSVRIFHANDAIESRTGLNNPLELSPVNSGVLDLGVHTIEFDKTGYQLFNVTVNITETSGGEEFNYTILFTNIRINLFDDSTKEPITNKLFFMQLSGPTGYFFESNGTLFDLSTFILSGSYTGLISSEDYERKEIFFTYDNQEIKSLDVYFIPLNLTNLGFVTVVAYQADNTPAKYISAYAKQWFASEGIFKKVQETKTGGDGKAELKIILEDYIYQFCIYTEDFGETCTGDEIIKTTENGQEIPITEERRVETINSYSELLDFTESIELQVSNVTGFRNLYVQFDWVDLSGFDLELCYVIQKDYQYTTELVDSDCVAGSAGLFQQIYLLNSTYSYIVDITATIDGIAMPMHHKVFESGTPSESAVGVLKEKGMLSLALVLYIVVIMTIVALLKNPFHGVVVVFVAIIGINTIFASFLHPYALSSLMTFCGMTAWGLRELK